MDDLRFYFIITAFHDFNIAQSANVAVYMIPFQWLILNQIAMSCINNKWMCLFVYLEIAYIFQQFKPSL